MPKFLIHETLACEVTFVKLVEADDETDALNVVRDTGGDLLAVSIGDNVAYAGGEPERVLDAVPYNLPVDAMVNADEFGAFKALKQRLI